FSSKLIVHVNGLSYHHQQSLISYYDKIFSMLRIVVSVSFLVLTIIFSIIFLNVTNRIAGPIFNIKRKIRKARETGNLELVSFRSDDFFQDLAKEYNELVLSLKEKQKKDKKFESGFSLLEILIVMGLMSVIAIGGM